MAQNQKVSQQWQAEVDAAALGRDRAFTTLPVGKRLPPLPRLAVVHREKTKACFPSLQGTLWGSGNAFRAGAISLHNTHHVGCPCICPWHVEKEQPAVVELPVVKRCLVGWSGGLFMLPGAAGEDWVRPRAWWGTVDRLRGA